MVNPGYRTTLVNTTDWDSHVKMWTENGEVYVYAPMTNHQVVHILLVSIDLILGFVALGFGLLTFLKKPLFQHQALIHKHLGRWWVFFMMTTAYQSTWAVEVGTPLFIVYLMTALYTLTGLGVYIIRIRGDLKENEKYAKNEKLFKIMKIAHAVVMGTAWVIVLSAAFARYRSFTSRYGIAPFRKTPCMDFPNACVAVPLCYPAWMNVTSTAGLDNIRPYV